MPRDLCIGNGSLLVNFDSSYNMRDLFFPYVGLENHTSGHISRFGVWVENRFAWLNDPAWSKQMLYEKETLVTAVELDNPSLGLHLSCADAVDFDEPIYLKRVIVENKSDHPREIRLFFHFDQHLYDSDIGDTAYFDPVYRSLVHYKKQRYFWLNGQRTGGNSTLKSGFDAYAIGHKEMPDQEGTWRDAEDGILGHNPISQGSIDTVAALHVIVKPGEKQTAYFWMIAAIDYHTAQQIDEKILERGPENFLQRTSNYWTLWVNKIGTDFADLPSQIINLYKQSLLIIRTQIDNHGAIIAANDTDILQFGRDTYSYMWPRDGSLVAYALTLAGHGDLPRRFFSFCQNIMGPGGYLLHKYNPDGSLGSSWHPWSNDRDKLQLPIQEDETALVLYSLWTYYDHFRDVEFVGPLYRPLIKAAGEFLLQYREHHTKLPAPSYDLWEERRGILTFTVSAVWAGLVAVANFTDAFGEHELSLTYRQAADEVKAAAIKYLYDDTHGYFVRMINVKADGSLEKDFTVDSSVYAIFDFGMLDVDDPFVVSTMKMVEQKLWCKTAVGGVARYENDYYHQVSHDLANIPGNPWFICTLWLAQWYIAKAKSLTDLDHPLELLNWVQSHALPSGVLAEQVNPYTDAPLSVSPLTWSHAAFVTTVLSYVHAYQRLHLEKTFSSSSFEIKKVTSEGSVVVPRVQAQT